MRRRRSDFTVFVILLVTFAIGWFFPLTLDARVGYAIGWLVALVSGVLVDRLAGPS